MFRFKTVASATLVALLLVVAADYAAFASTGQSLLLGKFNSANKITVVKRTTAGAALKVVTKSNSNPPFVVNGHGKVAHLNADLLDGKSASEIAPSALQYVVPGFHPYASSFTLDLSVPAGTYLVTYHLLLYPDTDVVCSVKVNSTNKAAESVTSPYGSDFYARVTASDLVTVPDSATTQLYCSEESGTDLEVISTSGVVNSVVFVPLDHVAQTHLTP
jgi:hypothetical protein